MSDQNLIPVETVRENVRERYGQIAAMNTSCCGTPDDSYTSQLYEGAMLEGLPADVTNLSLGCGDPISIAGLKAGERVLDLGSGGGIDCFLAARQVGATGYVIGVDMTDEMLAKANASKARMGVENVEFRQGYIEKLPVEDNNVDVIISNCVINLSADKRAVMSEAFRVLKPGGRLSISDIVTVGTFSEELRADMNKWSECVTGAMQAEDFLSLLAEIGFESVEMLDKANAENIIPIQSGMPQIFSARITAYKPNAAG